MLTPIHEQTPVKSYLSVLKGKKENESFVLLLQSTIRDCEETGWDTEKSAPIISKAAAAFSAFGKKKNGRTSYLGSYYYFMFLSNENIRSFIFWDGVNDATKKLCKTIADKISSMRHDSSPYSMNRRFYENNTELCSKMLVLYPVE